ncbi:protein daughter of sevenless [Anthonomus grandis grandis]|uniref:protein daughter of sevenless n=1 Tax=Anthonomus grandis grandis TaxID=2921223 RepID=UPI00216654FE|nr:protein daughter of sevenless [Anthonomus grandis grandis]
MAKSSEEVVFEGWLTKSPPAKRIFRAKWRRRWFLLTHSGDIPGQYILTYYTDRNRRKTKGVIDLDHCEQVDLGLKHEDRHLKFDHVFDIKTPSRTYYLAADTQEEMKSWVTCICRVCGLKSTNEDEDIGLPMNIPDGIEFTENLHSQKFTETPPISPASPSPYIAISECITGKSPVRDPKDVRSLLEYNNRDSNRCISHNNDSYEYHPQSSYVNYGNVADRNYVNDLQDPRFYDCPRSLGPRRSNKDEQGSPLQSPTDSDSVFNDDEWVHMGNDSDISKKSRPSDSSIHMETSATQRFVKPGNPQLTLPPPRPPKPPHITPPPCYLNLNSTPSKQEKDTEDKTKIGTQKILTDDMYDFPRSHNVETETEKNTLQRRHCYNNAAPTKCAEGIIFRYDISPKPSTSSVTSVFRYDLEAMQDLEPSSPAHSHSSSTPGYSNLPSPLLTESQLMLPPTVNRELKPKRKLSDTHSTSSNTEPPSPRTAAPSIDRKLKPTTPLQEANMRKVFQVSDDDGTKRIRAAPSPTPHSMTPLADDLQDGDVDVYLEINRKMQYLDLDLEGPPVPPASATKTLPKGNESDTVYKQVDFVKTEAFNITRNNLEKDRQEPVTTFGKK